MDLRQMRLRLGLSLEDVGSALGVSANTVRNWEDGTSTPRPLITDVPKYLKVYGTNLHGLISAVYFIHGMSFPSGHDFTEDTDQ